MSHTPTPWKTDDLGRLSSVGGGFIPLRTPFRPDAFKEGPNRSDHKEETLIANAELIVRAVNSHEAMKAALTTATHELNAIRARDGAPQHIDWDRGHPIQTSSCTEEYWNELTNECYAALTLADGKEKGR